MRSRAVVVMRTASRPGRRDATAMRRTCWKQSGESDAAGISRDVGAYEVSHTEMLHGRTSCEDRAKPKETPKINAE